MCRNKHKPCRHNQPFDGVIERFFGRLPLHSTPPSNRATGLSRKPQVVGEQNESLRHPESKRREQACSMPIGLGGLAEFVIGAHSRDPSAYPTLACPWSTSSEFAPLPRCSRI